MVVVVTSVTWMNATWQADDVIITPSKTDLAFYPADAAQPLLDHLQPGQQPSEGILLQLLTSMLAAYEVKTTRNIQTYVNSLAAA